MKTKTHTKYKTRDGKRVASVTTILNMIAKPALIHWAWKLGCDGQDYRKVRDKAANIGTIAHYLAECHLLDTKPDLSDYAPNEIAKAENAFIGFLDFLKEKKVKPIWVEKPLVSEKYRYGGTIDCYAKMGEKLALLDLKTSKGLYPEMRLQIAAYKNLLDENDYKTEETYLLRIDKKDGSFHIHHLRDLTDEWEMFKLLKRIYPIKKQIWRR